ncbi:hypothetical protein [Tepidibacillus decaturensis]|uniref:Radical SAM protein n=2 Tax=Bacillaceae TaxID=186817 RepID=A0A135L3M1_9BACI|nr:hypothetical protein [Tepidibacillus decaturensis]KXG43596.1 hypothetical protein U473_05885 [Tepidibacillus decaturensis]
MKQVVKFVYDFRLGINIPQFDKDWEEYSTLEQSYIIDRWEQERAKIPDRIKLVEKEIMEKQELMFEMSFEEYCKVHEEIVDKASVINELNIWFRTQGEVTE